MVSRRTAYRGSLALLGVLALLCVGVSPAWATHVTWNAPTLDSPDGNAHLTEGDSVTLRWTGALQGDGLASSYFRIEIAAQGDVPAGQQSAWPQTVNYTITDAGVSATSIEMGVPAAGVYEWRVCAWGVHDASVENTVEQLGKDQANGGCTQGRALTADEAVAPPQGTVGTENVQGETHTYQKPDTVIKKITTTPLPADPAQNTVIRLRPGKNQQPKVDTDALGAVFGEGEGSSVNLGSEGLFGGRDDGDLGGAYGVLAKGLGATLPGVPIPFWSLLLLLVAVPFTMWWGRSTLGMFEWPDEGESLGPVTDLTEDVKPGGDSADEPTTRDHTAAGGRLAA